ncbi:hypothetical protein [Hymenobacter sp. BT559]|uniref:hypothetical protein n=1 Tax=Hymenobacter sp. BT559 TaxID=2795729 RepID=UPI0018EC0E22|nr:hypothetical protein [Hymenobacter sp. BT559]MBJ6143470.1 hypothetical protein [Hymenobacter sp. BT559]
MLLLFAAYVAVLARPLLAQAPADTLRQAVAPDGTAYAWGVVQLRSGARLRAYLPAGTAGAEFTLPYYLALPGQGTPWPRPKRLALSKVQWALVRGQYAEALPASRAQRTPDRLAARLVAGPVELLVVKSPPLRVSFLGSMPVLSSPNATTPVELVPEAVSYYLRRPGQPAVLLQADAFVSQVSTLLADDAELARRIRAGQAGYRWAELPSLVQQYNQRH